MGSDRTRGVIEMEDFDFGQGVEDTKDFDLGKRILGSNLVKELGASTRLKELPA